MALGRLLGRIASKLTPQSVKEGFAEDILEGLGHRLADAAAQAPPSPPMRAWNWAMRNKAIIGAGFVALAGWTADGCAPVYGVTIIGGLLPDWLTCSQLAVGLFGLGCFGLGSGVLDKDTFARYKQIRAGKLADPRTEPRVVVPASVVGIDPKEGPQVLAPDPPPQQK